MNETSMKRIKNALLSIKKFNSNEVTFSFDKELKEAETYTESLEADLKECPFCGHKSLVWTDTLGYKSVQCGGCFSSTAYYQDVNEVVELWNKRV